VGDLSDREAVLSAMEEFDGLGRDEFLRKYGFGRSQKYRIRHDGRLYDVKAVLAAAYARQFPDRPPLTSENSTSGLRTTVPKARELGFEVEGAADGSVEPRRSFLFQANPAYYDVASAVRDLDEMNWSVRQSSKQIHAGDRVYVWESGPSGGVVAEGTILTDPAPLPEQEGAQFIRDPSRFEGENTRVRLSIDRVIDPPLARARLLRHPVLKDLGIIRFANATNYGVSEEQDAALQEMIDAGAAPSSLEELVATWREETGYPTERDLNKKAQRESLSAVLTEESLERVIDDPEQFDALRFGQLASTAYGGAGNQATAQRHINEGPEAKLLVAEALRHLLFDEGDVGSRLDDVLLKEEWHPTGFGEGLATKSLAIVDPDRWLPLYQYSGPKGKLRLMESPELGIEVPPDLEEWSLGRRVEWTNDRLRELMEPLLPGDPWGQMVFLYWLRERHAPTIGGGSSLSELAEELLVERAWLEGIVGLLEEKRQVIFQGPPGTGKTYVARRLGRYFEEQGGQTETVQFHPSYSYEDFVEGYRPTVVGGQPGFELVQGPLKRLAMNAEADPDHRYVLIIDELNRGNVAKVFGELYFLLEYRSERIRLQYAGPDDEGGESRFALPKNLWIIATMNTADRSIALMDAALRRRFYFVDYYPDRPPVEGLLSRWLERHGLEGFAWVSAVLEQANAKLDDREAAIGPSHFLLEDPAELSEERIARIWSHAVLPYLQERLMGEPQRLVEFELELLRSGLPEREAPAPGEEGGGGAP
jgi:dynein-related subfamily AAA family protein/EVE domain-containing protein